MVLRVCVEIKVSNMGKISQIKSINQPNVKLFALVPMAIILCYVCGEMGKDIDRNKQFKGSIRAVIRESRHAMGSLQSSQLNLPQ